MSDTNASADSPAPDWGACGLQPIFRPRSVAVIGAGRDPRTMSGRLFRNLAATFRGPVYPIHPVAREIAGHRAWRSVLEVADPIDLAFVAVPSPHVLGVVRECLEKGVRGLVVISAGFSETGAAGRALEKELVDLVRRHGVRLVGPNCFGVFNTAPEIQLSGTFAAAVTPPGNIGMASQSGALGVVIPDFLKQFRLGASSFASVGNKADVQENDLLDYWREDPATRVIVLYLESFGDPAGFRQRAREITRIKPIVALKAARTAEGARAASSHTAALASPERAVDALFQQSGVLRVDTLQELFDVTALLSTQPLPRGDRVAILTNAGGPGILCADHLAAGGLVVPETSPELQRALRNRLRPEAGVRNPVDLIGSIEPDEFRDCLQHLLVSGEFDAVITIYVPREAGTSAAIAQGICDVTRTHADGVTSLAVFLETCGTPVELAGEGCHVPGYQYPESAAQALCGARRQSRLVSRPVGVVPDVPEIDRAAVCRVAAAAREAQGMAGGWLSPEMIFRLLETAGVNTPRWSIVTTAEDAVIQAGDWGSPVVLKVVSSRALHKSDRGGVAVNLNGELSIRGAFDQVWDAAEETRGVLVQEYIPGGCEAFVGLSRDPQFGPLIALGSGGTLVELWNDVACRLAPLTDIDAASMLESLRLSTLLRGYRDRAPADRAALTDLLHRVSLLAELVPDIAELDFNPVSVRTEGAGVLVLDARIRLAAVGG